MLLVNYRLLIPFIILKLFLKYMAKVRVVSSLTNYGTGMFVGERKKLQSFTTNNYQGLDETQHDEKTTF